MTSMITRTHRSPKLQTATALVSAAVLAACSGGSGSSPVDGPGDVGGAPNLPVTVASNVSGTPGSAQFFTASLNNPATSTLTTGSNEGVAYDATATLVQAGDNGDITGGVTGLRFFSLPNARGGAFNALVDREIDLSGGNFGGKGIEIIDSLGRIIVANNAGSSIDVFSTTAGPGAAALAQLTLSSPPWDVAYDTTNDRLYVAVTDGTVAIYDDFAANVDDATTTPDRTITPVDDMDVQVSANMHGIAIREGSTSAITVSDVGAITSGDGAGTDGALFRINDDGMLDGNVPPSGYYMVTGDQTLLGNPVDLTLSGTTVIVAEKANNLMLAFNRFTPGSGIANIAPDFQREATRPESVTPSNLGLALPVDNTDITTGAGTVYVTSNPAPQTVPMVGTFVAPGTDNATVTFLDAADLSESGTFDANEGAGTEMDFRSTENIQIDTAGNAYISFDTANQTGAENTGIVVINLLASRAGGADELMNTDRDMAGASSELISPKGVEIVQSNGIMLIADVGGNAIRAYSLHAGGGDDFAPLFSTTEVGSGSVWDIDYDPATDTLFAAGTAGELLVYADYLASAGDVTPTATRLNSDAMATSNLHGIAHIGGNALIVSDVGDAANADDGLIYVVDASGTPTVTRTVSGPADDALGNPVDLAYDGTSLFVAEKSDGMVYRFDSILSGDDGSLEPDAEAAVTAPESVALVR